MTIVDGGRTCSAVPSYYEINVALNGHHLFATAERSCNNVWQFKKVLEILKQKLPVEEGYSITATAEYSFGRRIDVEEVDAE